MKLETTARQLRDALRMLRFCIERRNTMPILGCVLIDGTMWSNPGETIYSPFTGIGSEGYEAVRHSRRFIGTELSQKYFPQAVRNLKIAETSKVSGDLLQEVIGVAAQ